MILSNDQERVNPNQNKSLVYHTVMQQSSPDSLQHQSKKEYQHDLSNNQERVYTNQNKFSQL